MYAIFLDIETTGLDLLKHRPIEIACQIIDLKEQKYKDSYHSIIKQPQSIWDQRNVESLAINGFTWEEVLKGQEIAGVAQEIIDLFKKNQIQRGSSVFICQNPAFDRAFFYHVLDTSSQERLNWPYHWLDLASMYWGIQMRQCGNEGKKIPATLLLSKNEIAKLHGISPEIFPHRAANGVKHLIACYEALFDIHFFI